MSPTEIVANITGLRTELETLKADKTSAAAALVAETSAKALAEAKLATSEAAVNSLTAKVGALEAKISAAAAPAPDPDEEKGKSDAQGMLEAVLEFIKGLLPKADDDSAKADDEMDASDDTEAKAFMVQGKKAKALAVRAKTVQRKITALKGKTIPIAALPSEVAKQIAKIGIPAALALNKDAQTTSPNKDLRGKSLVTAAYAEQLKNLK